MKEARIINRNWLWKEKNKEIATFKIREFPMLCLKIDFTFCSFAREFSPRVIKFICLGLFLTRLKKYIPVNKRIIAGIKNAYLHPNFCARYPAIIQLVIFPPGERKPENQRFFLFL